MNIQNKTLQERVRQFETKFIDCLLYQHYEGARNAYTQIRHIKEDLLGEPKPDSSSFQELLDESCADDDIYLRGRLGSCLLYGDGIEQNEEVGIKMLRDAVNCNCMYAYSVLDDYFSEKKEATFLKNLEAYPDVYSEGVDNG